MSFRYEAVSNLLPWPWKIRIYSFEIVREIGSNVIRKRSPVEVMEPKQTLRNSSDNYAYWDGTLHELGVGCLTAQFKGTLLHVYKEVLVSH